MVLMESRGGGSLRQLLALNPQSGTGERKAGSLLPFVQPGTPAHGTGPITRVGLLFQLT